MRKAKTKKKTGSTWLIMHEIMKGAEGWDTAIKLNKPHN